MDYSREKIEVFEVDKQGNLLESYIWDAYEIDNAIAEGKIIIQHGWGGSMYEPTWDFKKQEWVHGISEEEIQRREQDRLNQDNQPSELEVAKKENEMLAMAVMELSSFLLGGE